VRAELHLYDDLDPPLFESALRQARVVLQERYLGGAPVPVRILETLQVREEMIVRLPPMGARSQGMPNVAWKWRPHGMIGAAILLVVALIWVVNAWIGSGGEPEEPVANSATPASAEQQSGEVAQEETPVEDGEVVPASEQATSGTTGGTDLPASRNARGDLGIGMNVQVVPGLRIALRSEPGADRGIVVGEMSEGVIATIVGGPEYTEGDSDTIVWWFVNLPNGTEAWAAANTSQQTLLMPAE
jgi:hypothetical protein